MNKAGQFFEALGILVVVGMAVVGTTVVYLSKDNVFIGNKATTELYDYDSCPEIASDIPTSNVVRYDSLETAQSDGFVLVECHAR